MSKSADAFVFQDKLALSWFLHEGLYNKEGAAVMVAAARLLHARAVAFLDMALVVAFCHAGTCTCFGFFHGARAILQVAALSYGCLWDLWVGYNVRRC